MERNVNYILIGGFITLVAAVFAGFVIWMAGSYDTRNYDRYTVYFEGPVGGIGKGSKVLYLGIDVGQVVNIRLDKTRSDLIKVDIEVDENTPVRKTTKVSLKPNGITGQSVIELKTRNKADDPPVRKKGEKYPVLRGEKSRIDALIEKLPQVTDRLIRISGQLEKALSDENIKGLSTTIRNLESLTGKLDHAMPGTLDNVNLTLDSARESFTSAGELIARSGKTVDELHKGIIAARSAIDNTVSITSRVDKILDKNEGHIDNFFGTTLDELTHLTAEARSTVIQAEALSRKLSDRPSRLIFQDQYKGLKIPKE